ncbi:MAG: putative polysaccharide biosynthesis protein [Oscillospiraceae bacterium]
MAKPKKQTFLEGALVLSLSIIIVKLVGATFKLPLNNILGGEGMGYFSSAYTFFNLFNSLAIAGLPVSISKIVSEKISLNRYRDARKVLSVSFFIFSFAGIVLSVFMYLLSPYISSALNNEGAYLSMVALSPAIFFICIMSVYKGYYQGLSQMTPTAISQIIEALSKLLFGLSIAYIANKSLTANYITTGKVLGKTFYNDYLANDYIIQITSAGAVLGVTISTFIGVLYLLIKQIRKKDLITKKMLKQDQETEKRLSLFGQIVKIAIPVSLAAVVVNITSVIDLGSILTRLTIALSQDSNTIISIYKDALPNGLSIDKIPNFLYGSYSGMAVSIFNLVPSLTVAFGVSALPVVTSAFIKKNKLEMSKQITSILKITCILAIPAGIGIYTMAYPILNFLFENQKGEVLIAETPLSYLGIASIFVAISIPINSILQGIGRADLPVKLMIFGAALKLALNYWLVSIPSINIKGAPIGTMACYLFIVLSSLYLLIMLTGVKLSFKNILLKPTIAGVFCGISCKLSYNIFYYLISSKYVLIPSIFIGVIVYILSIFYLKTIDENDIKMLPKGDILAKGFKKKGYI